MESQLTVTLKCSTCGDLIDEPSLGWADGKDGYLCQMCWEEYTSETWWEELRRVQDYVWARDFVPPLHPLMARALNAARERETYAEPAGCVLR